MVPERSAAALPRPGPAIPPRAGVGLRGPHCREMLARLPDLGFLEVHSENYFGDGGPPHAYLERLRAHYPFSLHGVGLSLGSTDPLSRPHLEQLRRLIERYEPGLVSEHLCWSSQGGVHLHDLLPLPYTEEALDHVVDRIAQTQEHLGREILIENVSSYLTYRHSVIPEWEFLAEAARRADCGILLDVNNIHVSATNHGFSALAYLEGVPGARVREIHLAGFAVNHHEEGDILIDHHGARVDGAVWDLYAQAVRRLGPAPTLVEWDTDLPPLAVLLDEAATAERILEGTRGVAA